jgi:hypothetical protein
MSGVIVGVIPDPQPTRHPAPIPIREGKLNLVGIKMIGACKAHHDTQ